MISGQWFQRKHLRISQKMHKITNNSMQNIGSTPISTHINTKFEENLCCSLKEEVENVFNEDG